MTSARPDESLQVAEIRHRMKNGFQLLQIFTRQKLRHCDSDEARRILSEILHQIDAVASLQVALTDADLGKFYSFMVQIASHWAELGRGQGVEVIVMQDAPEHLTPSVSENAARILTEAVTNALEHAFPNGREGHIEVAAYIDDDGMMRLSVADDGVGMTARPGQGQGTEIILALAEGLGGRALWSNRPAGGATLSVTFPAATDYAIFNGAGTHANG